MFSLHAKAKNVNLNFDSNILTNTNMFISPLPLLDTMLQYEEEYIDENDFMFVDINKMRQVIRNVMSNALKFTPSGKSVTLRVRKTREILPCLNTNSCTTNCKHNLIKNTTNGSTTAKDMKRFSNWYYEKLLRLFDRKNQIFPGHSRNDNRDIEIGLLDQCCPCHRDLNIESQRPIGTLVIQVIDSGVGIAIEDQERLFKEIVQFNPSVLQGGGGSGLGMMVSIKYK